MWKIYEMNDVTGLIPRTPGMILLCLTAGLVCMVY